MSYSTNYSMQSNKVALARLRAMKVQDPISNTTNCSEFHNRDTTTKRIPNPCPPDNNPLWNNNHNPLSSKGD